MSEMSVPSPRPFVLRFPDVGGADVAGEPPLPESTVPTGTVWVLLSGPPVYSGSRESGGGTGRSRGTGRIRGDPEGPSSR